MSNKEKFEMVFGFKPNTESCVISEDFCEVRHEELRSDPHFDDANIVCCLCKYYEWWNNEYNEAHN